jgi:hypothetical protein
MNLLFELDLLSDRKPVPLSAMLIFAAAESVGRWGGYGSEASEELHGFLATIPHPEEMRVRCGPFGNSRCLVLWGSAGCGASVYQTRITSAKARLECASILTPLVDLDDEERPSRYECDALRMGWTHFPKVEGRCLLVDPILPGDEGASEGVPLDPFSGVDVCLTVPIGAFGKELAQLHCLLNSARDPLRDILGMEYSPGLDRSIRFFQGWAMGSDLSI